MHSTVLEPVGVEIDGLQAADVNAATADTITKLLADHGVVVLRRQRLTDDGFVGFLRQFGELVFTVGETPVDGYPDLNVISNVGRRTAPRSVFHVDTSYISRPPAYTALRAVQIPVEGGETLFTNQYRAYETLPDEVRDRLRDRTVRHVVTGVDPGDAQETAASHPVFRPHPLTGRVALYLSTPQRCVGISGIPDADARDLIRYLYEHSTQEHNTYRHTWLPGDVVIWDNGCVMHRADHSGAVGDRVMHRGMATGYASLPSVA